MKIPKISSAKNESRCRGPWQKINFFVKYSPVTECQQIKCIFENMICRLLDCGCETNGMLQGIEETGGQESESDII